MAEQLTPEQEKKLRKWLVWGFFGFTMLLTAGLRTKGVLEFPNFDFPMGPPNPDVWLRLTQVRQWLTGGDFFDHGVHHTNGPFGGITTPWTRPIDIILSVLYHLVPGNLSPTLRLMVAACWMTPFMCIVAMALMAKTARRHFNQIHVLIVSIFMMVFSPYLGDYFTPGDADHHGLMSTFWCGVLCLITLDPLPDLAAFGAGVLLGCITWVSPEGLMLIAPVYALLGLEALFRPQKMTTLAILTAGAAVMVSAALTIERPIAELLKPVYDSLSVVHVLLLWLVAAAAGFLAAFYEKGFLLKVRMVMVAVAGVAVLAVMYLVYPKFFGGPMVDADPFIFKYFLPNVTEAQPLHKSPLPDVIRELAEPLLALFLLAATFWRNFKTMRPEKRRYLLLLGALLGYTTLLTLVQIRWEYYLQPIAIILCAALLPGVAMATRFRLKKPPPRQWRPYLWMLVVFAAAFGFAKVAPTTDRSKQILCMNQVRYVLQTQQLQPLLGDNDIVVYLPENAGGDALYFTPYRIIGSNYHREAAGMKDMHALAGAKNEFDAYVLLSKRQVKAMLYCPTSYAMNSWLQQVTMPHKDRKVHYPQWMTPVGGLKFFDYEEKHPKPLLFKIKT